MSRALTTAALLPAWMGLTACKDGVLTRIDVDGSATSTVQGGNILTELVGTLGFSSFTAMDITSAEELQNQGVEPGDIKDVRLISFELEAIDPSGADLAFIESMAVDVEAPDLEQVQIASATDFPAGVALVEFDIEDIDLTEYVVSESMTLTTDVTGNQPPEDTTVEARYLLEVGVTLQGATNARKND